MIGHVVSIAGAIFVAAFLVLVPLLAAFFAARASSAALAGADSGSFFVLASAVAAVALGAPDRQPGREDPPDAGDGLAADRAVRR